MKKNSNSFLTFIILLFCIGLIVFSSTNIIAAQSSLNLFLNTVFPSLFPFLIVSDILSYTFIIPVISSKFAKIMNIIFKTSPIGSYPFVMGIICGYPVGARIVSSLYSNKKITKKESEFLLIISNNAGPLFIIGSVGYSIYSHSTIGYALLFIHILSCFITGFLFGKFLNNESRNTSDNTMILDFSTLGEILSNAIKKAFQTIAIVCGFIVIFSLVISMLEQFTLLNTFFYNCLFLKYFLYGFLEITNGISTLSTITAPLILKLCATSFLLGFGGLSVLLQVWSIIAENGLSIKLYFIGKIINGLISASLSFAIFSLLI